jgi:hypothetical protein
VDDIFNYEDVNVDHNNCEEPQSNNVLNSNASQRNIRRKVEVSKDRDPATSEEDEESCIE